MYGKHLKEIRKYLSVTQDEMAKLLSMQPRTYVSYEREENNPPYSMLVCLCKKYNINLNWFIADVGDMFRENTAQQDEQLEKFVAQIVDKKLAERGLN